MTRESEKLISKAGQVEQVEKELRKVKQKLENLIKSIDSIELLSQVLLVQLTQEEDAETNYSLRDRPFLYFLTGLCLKNSSSSNKYPNAQEIGEVIELLDKYLKYYQVLLLFSASDDLTISAKTQKMIRPINPNVYHFQLEDFLRSVYSSLDSYFINKYHFTITDALNFGQKIIKRYERLLNKRLKEAPERVQRELNNPTGRYQAQEIFKQGNITKENLIESRLWTYIFTSSQDIFVFTIDEFCKDEGIQENDKFESYLEAISCKFGEVNENFNSPIDENAITTKPIINIDDGKYFSPIPQNLIFNLPMIFEELLIDEKQKQTRVWQKYQLTKSKYTENNVCKYLSRIFPKKNIFRNIEYHYQGKKFEVDTLVLYDDKIFIIESKAGAFTEPAKRGAIKRLETDLKKLIGKAYQQGKQVKDYVESTTTALFQDRTGKEVIELKSGKFKFFLINVTLEHLMDFATNLNRLRSLGLFEKNEYPWSVNLFDLDIITRHIVYPTIFIHYIEKRLLAQNEDVFFAFDELDFFAWYIEKGNFQVPLTDNNKRPDMILVGPTEIFDYYYLYGKDKPQLKIESELIEIIKILEILHPIGYSNITSALLDLDHQSRELIFREMNRLINKTKMDRDTHSLTIFYRTLDMGLTFIAQYRREGLKERLAAYCAMKKYQTKATRWIGIGRDVLDNKWFANEFVYLDFPWKNNPKMNRFIDRYLVSKT